MQLAMFSLYAIPFRLFIGVATLGKDAVFLLHHQPGSAAALIIRAEIGNDVLQSDAALKLLTDYNDGHRKTFYCSAVYLLPLEDLKNVAAKLENQPKCSVKERAAAAVELLQELADGHGVCLNLKKKKG